MKLMNQIVMLEIVKGFTIAGFIYLGIAYFYELFI